MTLARQRTTTTQQGAGANNHSSNSSSSNDKHSKNELLRQLLQAQRESSSTVSGRSSNNLSGVPAQQLRPLLSASSSVSGDTSIGSSGSNNNNTSRSPKMQKSVLDPWFFLPLETEHAAGACSRAVRGRYALGLFFISMVAVIWTGASVLAQYLYSAHDFDSPFFMTYFGTCLFAFLLPIKLLTDHIGLTENTCCHAPPDAFSDTWAYCQSMDASNVPTKTTGEGDQNSVTDYHDMIEGASIKTSEVIKGVLCDNIGREEVHWNHKKHFQAAAHIAPVMFIANWAFNAALASTSVASSTVLVSTSNVFVFILAVLAKDEKFSMIKLMGVLLGIAGTALTAAHDFTQHGEDSTSSGANYDSESYACSVNGCEFALWGDTLALIAAAAYGSYAVQVRLLCPRNEDLYSMQLLLGYIGIVIMVPLFPLAVILWGHTAMSWSVFGLIVLRGLFDYVLSEYLHFRAVILTNATTATVGLGLTIPLAFLADWIMGKDDILSMTSLLGAAAVTAGFLVVNLANHHDDVEHHGALEARTSSSSTNVINVYKHQPSSSQPEQQQPPLEHKHSQQRHHHHHHKNSQHTHELETTQIHPSSRRIV